MLFSLYIDWYKTFQSLYKDFIISFFYTLISWDRPATIVCLEVFYMLWYCHSRAAGRTRETRGKRNNGNLMMEHRIHNHIDELTDKDSGKTQGLWTHNNHGKQHQVRSKSNTDGDELTNDRKQEGPYKGVETQGKGRQSLTDTVHAFTRLLYKHYYPHTLSFKSLDFIIYFIFLII